MHNELARRRELAERAMKVYAAQPKIGAVLLAGSVARGTADAFSDIEIDIFWNEDPTDAERLAPIAGLGLEPLYIEADENEWADGFVIGGVKVDTSQFRVSTVERWLSDVIDQADTEIEKQLLIAAIQHGRAYSGTDLIARWCERAARYPDSLAQAMVKEYLTFRPRVVLQMLAERKDELFLRFCLADELHKVMSVLLGLNRLYVAHPHHKWLEWQAGQMQIAPASFTARLRALTRAEGRAAVEQLHTLEAEVFDLVEQHMPDLETADARREFDMRRAQ